MTLKRAKWALAPGIWLTIALVSGSRAVFDEGVKTPILGKFRMMIGLPMSVEAQS